MFLSTQEKRQYSDLIRRTLVTGMVPELGDWPGRNRELIEFIHAELRQAYEYITGASAAGNPPKCFLMNRMYSLMLQELDRNKLLANPNYTNEELYIPIILKAASSRMIIRFVHWGRQRIRGLSSELFIMGFTTSWPMT